MAGLDADTSSYNQPLPVGPLDQMQKIGAVQQQAQQIQSGALTIDKQKLDLMNQQFGLINQELSAMVDDPNITKEQAAARLNKFADTYKLPDVARQHMNAELQAAPSVKAFSENALRRGMDTQQKINQQYGPSSLINRGPDVVPVRTPGQTGMPVQTGPAIPVGTSPEFNQAPQEIYDPRTGTNKQGVRGQYTAGAGVKPLAPNMYQQPGATAPLAAVPNAPPLNAGPAVAQYSKEITDAPALLDEIKPVAQAIPLLEKLGKTGIGTAKAHDVIAALTNLGFVDQKGDNYAVNYEIANKKLSQFVQKNGSRSDADLASKAESSPNIKSQLNPALIKLARDAIATNTMKAERAMSFKNNPEFQGNQTMYPDYAAKRAAEQHPDAYKLSTYPEEEQQRMYADQLKKAKAGNKESQRFIRSLSAAEKIGLNREGP